jgi:CO/xanthine dehydrogenase FAD-binding subunit
LAALFRPRTLEDAVAIAARGDVTLMAGCTDLFPATPGQTLRGPVLDLTAVAGLRGILRDGAGWRIGATTTWAEIARANLPCAFDGLRAAAREVGAVQIQNAGTLGGNLCNASPAADGVPPLLTLDAAVELVSVAGVRQLPLGEFLTGPRRTALRPGEVLAAVLIPDDAGQGVFLKLGARASLVISIVMVAARLQVADGRVTAAALAVGACSAVATRLPAQEAALIGAPLAEVAARIDAGRIAPALSPLTDIRADAAYRRGAAVTLLRRAVAEAVA